MNKLDKIEQIEKKLGIDLITLFKALENGIWTKGGFYGSRLEKIAEFVEKPEIGICYYQQLDENYDVILEEENSWCIFTLYYDDRNRMTRLKDYGKTWALTREELKEDIK